MNRFAAIGFVLLAAIAAPAVGDHGFDIVLADLPPGEHYLKITVNADGSATSRPLSVANVTPGPGPNPPPTPTPSELTARAKEIKALAEKVTGDPNRDTTAKGLAELYRQLAKTVRTGQVSDRNALFQMVKMGSDLYLNGNPGNWQSVRDKLSIQWSQLPLTASVGDCATLLEEAASGLDASAPNKQISPELLALIMQIIQLILSLLNK